MQNTENNEVVIEQIENMGEDGKDVIDLQAKAKLSKPLVALGVVTIVVTAAGVVYLVVKKTGKGKKLIKLPFCKKKDVEGSAAPEIETKDDFFKEDEEADAEE